MAIHHQTSHPISCPPALELANGGAAAEFARISAVWMGRVESCVFVCDTQKFCSFKPRCRSSASEKPSQNDHILPSKRAPPFGGGGRNSASFGRSRHVPPVSHLTRARFVETSTSFLGLMSLKKVGRPSCGRSKTVHRPIQLFPEVAHSKPRQSRWALLFAQGTTPQPPLHFGGCSFFVIE